jgi:hypothetical protein
LMERLAQGFMFFNLSDPHFRLRLWRRLKKIVL